MLPWFSGPGGPPFHPAPGSSSVDGKLNGGPGGTPRLLKPVNKGGVFALD